MREIKGTETQREIFWDKKNRRKEKRNKSVLKRLKGRIRMGLERLAVCLSDKEGKDRVLHGKDMNRERKR